MAITFPAAAPVATRVRDKARQARAAVSRLVARYSRVSRVARARAGYGVGLLSTAWGIGVLWGFGWFLITAGVSTAWSFLHLYPVDDR